MFNIKKTILNLAVLAALCAPGANAQTPPFGQQSSLLANGSTVYLTNTGTWQNDEWNMESSIAKDGAGNIYVAGTFKPGGDYTRLFIKKINPLTGAEVWASTITNPNAGNDYARGVAITGAGALYVLGMMQDIDFNKIAVIRIDKDNGNTVGISTYGVLNSNNNAYDIVADALGAYVAGAINNKIAVIKFPANGNPAMAVTFDAGSYSAAYGIAFSSVSITPSRQLVVAGTINLGDDYDNEIWLGKFEKSDLSHVWASTYIPAANHQQQGRDEAHAVTTDRAGNIYAAGFYQSQDSGQDIWLGKYDPSGNLIYARTKNGPSNGYDKGFGLTLDALGNVYITGKLEAYTLNQDSNLWLGKYSPSGTLGSEVAAHRGAELGFDVEVSSWLVSVGGGFQNEYGLLTVSHDQFGAPQQLFAGPGRFTGSVSVSWVFETAETFAYKVQYSTYNGGWNMAAAQVSEVNIAANSGDTREHAIMGLPTIVTNTNTGPNTGPNTGANSVAGPVYYFRVWTSSGTGDNWTQLTNTANSAPYAPFNNWIKNDRGQDSFFVFNNARVRAAGMARDGAGNTFIAYSAGQGDMMQGMALSKINRNGELEWTSFHNSTSTNGRFNANGMVIDASSNIYVAGSAFLEGLPTGDDAWLAKFNSAGVLLWENIFDNPFPASRDQFSSLALNSGIVYAAGSLDAGGGQDMLIARYTAAGAPLSSATYNYNAAGQESYPTEIRGLAVDGSNIYAGGYISRYNGEGPKGPAFDRDAVVVKLDTSLVFISSHVFFNGIPAETVETFDSITGLAYSGGFLYAAGIKSNGPLPQFWAAKLNPANWAGVAAPSWESTYYADDLPAGAFAVKISSPGVYFAGFETRMNPPDGNRNILLRKYNMTTGAVAWTKSVDGNYQNEGAMAFGVEDGADGYFYLNSLFNIWGMGGDGQPGVARIAEPMTGIAAMTGPKPCSVQLAWVADTDLPQGTTFYVQYATYSLAAFDPDTAAQYSYFTDYTNFNGSYISRLVPGLEAGNKAPLPGQSNMDSPPYYFTLGYKKPADGAVTPIAGSTNAVANTPGTWDRMDRYPNGNLHVINNVHGERFPLIRDAAGNIYTAGSFSAWGGNSNTAYVRKSGQDGRQIWTRYYSDEYNYSSPVINSLALDAAGNLYAAGTKGSDMESGAGGVNGTVGMPGGPESVTKKDILLIKYNSSGRMLWQRSYDMAGGNDQGYGLALGPANIMFLAGKFRGAGEMDQAFLMALSTSGVVISSVSFSSAGETYFNALAYDSANTRLFAAGKNNNNGFVKVFNASLADLSLNITVNKGEGEDELYAVKVDTASAVVYLAGAVDAGGSQDAYIAKYDETGLTAVDPSTASLWEQSYNSADENNDEAYGLALDGLGGVYLSGSEFRYDLNQGKNIFMRKYSAAEGDLIWSQVLNSAGNNEDTAGGIAADAAGSVFAAVDAAQMGGAAGGYTAPGTYNPGNTANTANTINGAGYFKYTQSSMITTNPRLTVRV
ncbi:MAG: hypothetical protein Q7R35_13475, partial [Elusimicrobiota bacterium]|nr:hypothetical protein [Elusimicrobiota bacterium]